VEHSIFSGYLFARFRWEVHEYALITPGVHSVLSFGGRPAEISDEEMERVRLISLSPTPVQVLNKPVVIGKEVEIVYGPMQGLTGILLRQRGKLHFVVNIRGASIAGSVIVARDQVRPV
jgi:transcription antitermination factor NusG